jgi:hypothetical protein
MQSSYMCLAVYICGRRNGSSALLGVSDGRLGVWLRVKSVFGIVVAVVVVV